MKETNPKGAGRKSNYANGSKPVTFRIPTDREEYIRMIVKRWLTKFK